MQGNPNMLQRLLGALSGGYRRFDNWAFDGYLPGGGMNEDQRIRSKKNASMKGGLMDDGKPRMGRDDRSSKMPLSPPTEDDAPPAPEVSPPTPRVNPAPEAARSSDPISVPATTRQQRFANPIDLTAPQQDPSMARQYADASPQELMGLLSAQGPAAPQPPATPQAPSQAPAPTVEPAVAQQSQNPITRAVASRISEGAGVVGGQRDPFNNPVINRVRAGAQATLAGIPETFDAALSGGTMPPPAPPRRVQPQMPTAPDPLAGLTQEELMMLMADPNFRARMGL